MKKYTYIYRHLVFYIFFWIFLGEIINAQSVVNGTVVDLSGYPIIGATIISENDTVLTDFAGAFDVKESNAISVFIKGYRTQTLYSPFNNPLVIMEKDPIYQSVDVAYASQDRFGLTSAVSSTTSEELKDSYVTNIGSSLYGKLSGLIVNPSTGEPGNNNPSYLIRGVGTFNNENPLVFVDGLEMSMNLLKLEEIESISVLKDAAALAPFGIKGANGIIWVTTKRGIKGTPIIRASVQTGIQQPVKLPKFVEAYDYARLYNEARSNDYGNIWSPFYSDEQLNAYKNGDDGSITNYNLLYPNVNWYDEVLKSSSPQYNADFSVSGGNDMVRYFLLLGYQSSGGLYSNTDSKRNLNSNNDSKKINVRSNVDIELPSIFDARVTFGGVIDTRYTPSYTVTSLWENMAKYPANAFPVETPEGWGGTPIYPDNPKATVIQRGFREYHNRNIQAAVTLGQDLDFITEGLRLTETYSFSNYQGSFYYKDRNYQRFQPYYVSDDSVGYNVIGSQQTDFTISQTGTSLNTVDFRQNVQVALTYNRTFNLHQLQGSLVFIDDQYTIEGNNPIFYYRGFSGRFSYGFNEKYFAEIGSAVNGTGDFPKGNNLGFFPSLSLAWIASKEDFLQNSSVVNYLKLRLSTGLVGNNNIGGTRFSYQQYYTSGSTVPRFGTAGTTAVSTLYESTIQNPMLTWEKAFKTNIGLDTRLFQKLDAIVDLFYDRRYDILVDQNSLYTLGFLAGMTNDGVVTNHGIEVDLIWNDKIGDLTYYVNPSFSFARNKIVQMNEKPQAEYYLYRTGYSIGQPFALEAAGLFQSWEEINDPATPVQTFAEVQPGDIRYVDQNNDGIIDQNDVVPLKNYYSEIPEITYGLRIGVNYKGFDLNVSGYGVANRSVSLTGLNNWAFNDNANASDWALERWAFYPDQGIDTRSSATYPRLSLGSNSNNFRSSSFWMRNGNYFRIGELSLGYSLPRSFTMKAKIKKMRIFIMASNLLTFDHVHSVDPEVMTGYPIMKSYNLGLNVNF